MRRARTGAVSVSRSTAQRTEGQIQGIIKRQKSEARIAGTANIPKLSKNQGD